MKSTVMKISSIILIIIFFIPYFSVSCGGQAVQITGIDMTFGKEIGMQPHQGNFVMILLLLLPVAMLVISFSKKLNRFGSVFAVISSSVYFVLLFSALSNIKEQARMAMSTVRTEIAFYLSILLNILILVFVFFGKYFANKMNETKPASPSEGSQ